MTYKGLWPSASWLLSDLCEAQYVDWTWHPVLKLLMIFPLWGGGSSIHTSDGALLVPPHEPQHPSSTTTLLINT